MMRCFYVGRPYVWRRQILRCLSGGRQYCCVDRDEWVTGYGELKCERSSSRAIARWTSQGGFGTSWHTEHESWMDSLKIASIIQPSYPLYFSAGVICLYIKKIWNHRIRETSMAFCSSVSVSWLMIKLKIRLLQKINYAPKQVCSENESWFVLDIKLGCYWNLPLPILPVLQSQQYLNTK